MRSRASILGDSQSNTIEPRISIIILFSENRHFGLKPRKPINNHFSVLLVYFGQKSARTGISQAIIKAKVSTDRSDEGLILPGPTLSYTIVHIHPSGPDCYRLAMPHGKNGLKTGVARLHGPRLSREWLVLEPHGHILLVRAAGDGVPGSTLVWEGVPRVVGRVPYRG